MKSTTSTLLIATLILGSGLMNSASANSSSIDDSLNKVIVSQSTQLNNAITMQLKSSIKSAVSEMTLNRDDNHQVNIVRKKEVIKSKLIAEEE